MRVFHALVFVTVLCIAGCDANSSGRETIARSKQVFAIRTERFVTFVATNGCADELMERAQKTAERWIDENPEYETKAVATTFAGSHGCITVYFTLAIQKGD